MTDLAERVAPDYVHVAKTARRTHVADVPGGRLKWYEMHALGVRIPDAEAAAARGHLTAALTAGEPALSGDKGFVIHHRCGDGHLLLLCTWREDNELWETVWQSAGGGYEPVVRADPHLPTYCVWEMGVVAHEARAWSRYLRSDRGREAERAYFADHFAGEV